MRFPWPSDGERKAAAQALRDEQKKRCARQRETWAELGLPGDPPPGKPISAEDTVLIVLWSLRGQR